ncbi:hypothetical protein Scep_026383 [Stephania cephalantha]|uniref:Uncharacterized protein n=1 Tax=Stephania cephalantha TaxID=152367 RepID=A0AAP0ETW8_9MAGN
MEIDNIKEVDVGEGLKLTIQELEHVCDSTTGRTLTGSWVWDSALVLSEWMASELGRAELNLHGKTIIELGAGMGIPGLTAARLGATRVILTDIAPLLPGLRRNIELNGLEDRVEVRELVWGLDESTVSQRDESREVLNLVLMSDVFFDPCEMTALAKTLKAVSGPETRLWAATEMRPWTGECLAELVSQGFGVVELASRLGPMSELRTVEGNEEELPLFLVLSLVPSCSNSV